MNIYRLLFLFVLIPCCSIAQPDPGLVSFGSTPSASGATTPVQNNNFDGTANINIPFFNGSIDGVPIVVSAIYNTKGIKVDQIASSIGLGWDLYSGPTITRIQKDGPDEMFVPQYTTALNYTDVTEAPLITYTDPQYPGIWLNKPVNNNDWVDDSELDEFTLNLNGEIIKFLFNRDGSLEMTNTLNSRISIKRIVNGNIIQNSNINIADINAAVNLGFLVTDDAGNQYTFIAGDYTVIDPPQYPFPYTDPDNNNILGYYSTTGGSIKTANRWVVSKVITMQGSEIDYSYIDKTIPSLPLNFSESVNELVFPSYIYTSPYFQIDSNTNFYSGHVAAIDNINLSNNTKIVFKYDENDRRDVQGLSALQHIIIGSKFYGASFLAPASWYTGLYYSFNYSYFHTPTQSDQSLEKPYTLSTYRSSTLLRLKLNSIDKDGSDFNVDFSNSLLGSKLFYQFHYINGGYMPARLSPGQDEYGYANGQNPVMNFPTNGNGSTNYNADNYNGLYVVPHKPYYKNCFNNATGQYSTDCDASFAGTDRGLDVSQQGNYIQDYLIDEIKNSLGGEEDIQYLHEDMSNDLSSAIGTTNNSLVNSTPLLDGNIISQITYKDAINNDNSITEKYSYKAGNIYLNGNPMQVKLSTCYNDGQGSTFITNHMIYTNTGLNSLPIINGSNHGFSHVEIKKYNNNQTLLGTTILEFSNAKVDASQVVNSDYGIPLNNVIADNYGGQVAYGNPPYAYKQYFRDWLIGKPTLVEELDGNNQIMSKVSYNYQHSETILSGASNLSYRKLISGNDCSGYYTYYRDNYFPFTGSVDLVKTVSSRYTNSSNHIDQTTLNTYDNFDQLIQVNSVNSQNDNVETDIFYPTHSYTLSNVSGTLFALNCHKPLIKVTWKTSSIDQIKRLMSIAVSGYKLINNIPIPVATYQFLNNAPGYTEANFSGINSIYSMLDLDANNYTYDAAMFRQSSVTTKFALDFQPSETLSLGSLYNSTIYSQVVPGLALATVTNAKLADVAYIGFEDGENVSSYDIDDYQIPASIYNIPSLAGYYSYQLPVNTPGATIHIPITPTSGKNYHITFGVLGAVPIVKQGDDNITVSNNGTAHDNWTIYTANFTSNGGQIKISSNPSGDGYIDEVRVYPDGARMTTYTYTPLQAITSECDYTNRFTYYEYDIYGRKTVTRDNDGNVLSKKIYVTQGND